MLFILSSIKACIADKLSIWMNNKILKLDKDKIQFNCFLIEVICDVKKTEDLRIKVRSRWILYVNPVIIK